MSGLEIAGVVLGAVPLIVGALEKYKTTKKIWNRARKIALHIDELIETLAENQALIETSLELLQKAVDTEDACLDNNAMGYALRLSRKDIAQELQLYMGKLYKPYEKALLRCEKTLLKIVERIDGLFMGSKVCCASLARNDNVSDRFDN